MKLSNSGKAILIAVTGIILIIVAGIFTKEITTFDSSGWLRVILMAFIYIYGSVLVIKAVAKQLKKKPEQNLQAKSKDHGSAEWATREQFMAAGNNGTTEGLWIGDFWRRNASGHLLTIAGSGAGKNTCLIIPSLLINPSGSYVVTDPKGENAFITARYQKEQGQKVFILDPWNLQQEYGARHGISPAGFNPFDFINYNLPQLRDNCELIAYYLIPENPHVKDPYWDQRARALIKTILLHTITALPSEEHTFWTLYKMLRFTGDKWLTLLLEMQGNTALDGLISAASGEFIEMDPSGTAMSGIKSNAHNATTIFESPQLRASLEKSDFNPYQLADGNCTVYIVIPEQYLESHAAWLRLVVGLSLKAVNARPNKRVHFLMDEFAVMGKMKDVQKAFAFSRGQNIVMWAFAQSLSQIKEIYGEDGMNTFISNLAVFQAFGIKDQYTKEYVSKMLGDATYMKATTSINQGGRAGEISTGTSIQSYGRPLLTPEEVGKFNGIITITGELKYWINKIGYYQNRFGGLDWKDPSLNAEQKKLIKAGKLPDDLREIFAQRADPPPRILA